MKEKETKKNDERNRTMEVWEYEKKQNVRIVFLIWWLKR